MEASQEKLIAEINDKQIKYAVFRLNNKLDCEILSKKISKNTEIQAGKILDIKKLKTTPNHLINNRKILAI